MRNEGSVLGKVRQPHGAIVPFPKSQTGSSVVATPLQGKAATPVPFRLQRALGRMLAFLPLLFLTKLEQRIKIRRRRVMLHRQSNGQRFY